jgi:hypothetical protein
MGKAAEQASREYAALGSADFGLANIEHSPANKALRAEIQVHPSAFPGFQFWMRLKEKLQVPLTEPSEVACRAWLETRTANAREELAAANAALGSARAAYAATETLAADLESRDPASLAAKKARAAVQTARLTLDRALTHHTTAAALAPLPTAAAAAAASAASAAASAASAAASAYDVHAGSILRSALGRVIMVPAALGEHFGHPVAYVLVFYFIFFPPENSYEDSDAATYTEANRLSAVAELMDVRGCWAMFSGMSVPRLSSVACVGASE